MVPTCLWWFFRASWSCSPTGRVQWVRCPVLVWRADRSTSFWKEIGTNISRLPSGVVAPQTLCCWGFCSPLLSSLSWDRSVRGDCVQVNFLRCQGDADRCPGHVSHSSPLSVVLVPRARGEVGAGGGKTPDRPAKAAHRRESPSALALAVPARCRTSKWKSWSARNHRGTRALVSFARAIHCSGAWSVISVNFRPRR